MTPKMGPLPLLILWHIFGVMVGGMNVNWGSVIQEHNQKIATTKSVNDEDYASTERVDVSLGSNNLSGNWLLLKSQNVNCFDFSQCE